MPPEVCIQCVEAAAALPFDEGLAREAELSRTLHADPQSRAQRYYFFAERAARKIPDIPTDTPVRDIARVGVLGAGTMGGGISMAFANAGFPVSIVEQNRDALDRGLATVRGNYERSAARGRFTADQVEERMALLDGGTDQDAIAECDLVIEAVFEDMELKKRVFGQLDRIARPGALLATNTSYLDVNEIGGVTGRPEDVVGMHFFSPANIMKLVEVVRSEKSAPDAIATAMSISRTIGKVPALVGVCHGFVGNRMLFQRRLQADRLVLEGATPWDIDRVPQRLRHADGPVPHERPGRAGRRLERGDLVIQHVAGDALRARPSRPEDGPRLLHLRRHDARRSARSGGHGPGP